MKKLFFILLGFLVLILALGAVSFWQAPGLSNPKSLETIFTKLQEISPAGNESPAYQKFSDDKFKIEYPSDWMVIKEEGLLRALAPQEWAEKYSLEALFLAQSFQQDEFVQLILIIYKGAFGIPIEEIFEEMKKTNESNGWSVEVLESKTEANEGIFEGKYKNQAGTLSHSKEKVLISGKEGYLISLFALEKDWQELQETIDKILNSAIMGSEID